MSGNEEAKDYTGGSYYLRAVGSRQKTTKWIHLKEGLKVSSKWQRGQDLVSILTWITKTLWKYIDLVSFNKIECYIILQTKNVSRTDCFCLGLIFLTKLHDVSRWCNFTLCEIFAAWSLRGLILPKCSRAFSVFSEGFSLIIWHSDHSLSLKPFLKSLSLPLFIFLFFSSKLVYRSLPVFCVDFMVSCILFWDL